MRLAARLRADERALGDEERAGHAGALLVEPDPEVGVDVRRVGAEAGLGREDDAVGEGDVADLDRLEEGRGGRGHGDGHIAWEVQRSRWIGEVELMFPLGGYVPLAMALEDRQWRRSMFYRHPILPCTRRRASGRR